MSKPIGISQYKLTEHLPESIKSSLPSIEDIEKKLESEMAPTYKSLDDTLSIVQEVLAKYGKN